MSEEELLTNMEMRARQERQMKRHRTFMNIAMQLSSLGTCDRKLVGAVLVHDGRCISWGYNGAPPGFPHCRDIQHGWQSPVLDELEERYPGFRSIRPEHEDPREEAMYLEYRNLIEERIAQYGCRNATHAEANALAFAARQGISTDGCTLYVTLSPCVTCAALLIAAGIKAVFFAEEYRENSGLMLLLGAGVGCLQIG